MQLPACLAALGCFALLHQSHTAEVEPTSGLQQQKLDYQQRRQKIEEQFQTARTHQQSLVKYLLDSGNYDKLDGLLQILRVLPVREMGQNVSISLKMSLYQILDVIEPTQTIAVYTWMTQYWRDEYLGWDPAEFGGLTRLVLPYDVIWLPDTYLYNSVEMSRDASERWMSVILDTDNSTQPPVANVTFMYPTIYKFSCKLFIKYFPFDKQNCTMTFGSWTYDAGGISYEKYSEQVAMEGFVPNEEWKVLRFMWRREELKFACCPDPWILMHANLIIQRKPLFYLANLVLPSAIITMVATVGFFMPATTTGERTEKVNLGITTLLAMAILLLMVSDAMPTTSNFIPLLGWFYLNVILLTSIGTLLTSVVIWIQTQARFGEPVWRWVRRPVFWPLARWLHVPARPALVSYWLSHGYSQYGVKQTQHSLANAIIQDGPKPNYTTRRQQFGFVDVQQPRHSETCEEALVDAGDRDCDSPTHSPTPPLNETCLNTNGTAASSSRRHNNHKQHQQQQVYPDGIGHLEAVELEWEHLADILDRLLLICFSLAVAGVTASIFVTGLFLNEHDNVELQGQV